MSRVCYSFQRGECTRGSDCRFEHTSGGDTAGNGGYRPRNDGYSSRGGRSFGGSGGGSYGGDRPRGVCYAFQRGECDRGDSCRFSHSSDDGGAGGGGSGGGGYSSGGGYRDRAPRESRGAPGACYAFQRGECDRGDSCRYSHDASGISSGPSGGGGSRSRGLCHAFQRGECTRGDTCRFSHELEAAAE